MAACPARSWKAWKTASVAGLGAARMVRVRLPDRVADGTHLAVSLAGLQGPRAVPVDRIAPADPVARKDLRDRRKVLMRFADVPADRVALDPDRTDRLGGKGVPVLRVAKNAIAAGRVSATAPSPAS